MKNRRSSNNVDQKKVDFVIPVRGRFDILHRCLQSIPTSISVPYNVVIVDTTPDKKEADEFYETYCKDFVVVRKPDGIGFSAACNMGAKRKQSKFIFFLNSDVILSPNSVDFMLSDMNDPKIGIVGMKLLFPPDVKEIGLNDKIRPAMKVQHVGFATDVRGNFYHLFVGWDENNPKVLRVRKVIAVTGAAMLVRRNVFNSVGGFDEAYGLGTWEDIDLCMRFSVLGYNIVVNQDAIGFHYTGATSESYRIGFPLQLNQAIFMSRWYGKFEYTEWEYL